MSQGIEGRKTQGSGGSLFFGCDTIWNFDAKFFEDNVAFFTGGNVESPCYAYSVSVASTSKESLMKVDGAVENIQKFKGIAIRDNHTEEVLSDIYPREKILRTVDPTMLMFANIKYCNTEEIEK